MGTANAEDDREQETEDKAEAEAEETESKPSAAEDEHDDDGDEDEDDEVAEAAPKKSAAPAKAAPKASASTARASAKRPAPPPRGGASLTKNMVLFVAIIGTLAVGFAYLGKEEPQGAAPAPKWKTGQTVDVEITVVPNDVKELACASDAEIGGKHCQFEAQNKPWSKGPAPDDKHMLKPYTTTDRMQFVAAGLWSEDALSPGKMPKTRFSVKCKYTVEGQVKGPAVRWASDGPWYPQQNAWYAGSVSGCKLVQ